MRRLLALTASLIVLSACGGNDTDDAFGPSSTGPEPTTASPQPTQVPSRGPTAPPSKAVDGPARVIGTVATGLSVPWGIAFLPDGSALVTERDSGRVLHLTGSGGSWRTAEAGRIAETRSGAEAGLLGIAVSPRFDQDRAVFLYTSTESDNRVLRATFADGRLGATKAILTGIPRGQIHDGGRLEFGPDGHLYVSTGETGDPEMAQDTDALGGKVLRVTAAGKPAPGNPDPGSAVWSLGHRNVQGLAFDDAGRLWASEFGQNTWDELNLIQKGVNYGWPQVEGRGEGAAGAGFRNPQVVWRTDQASPSGLAFTAGHLWLASLRGERLWRIQVDGARASKPVDFFVGEYGRMRTVVVAPDGNLWVATSNRDGRGSPAAADDRILLVSP